MEANPESTPSLELNQGPPHLVILSQGSVSQEHFSKSSISKQVHVVVKNLVFLSEVGSSIDLNKCHLEAKLYYDFDKEDDEKIEVAFVKNEPLDYKVAVSDSGFKATVELRIKVLTSQHEDMLFRVHLGGIDPMTLQPFGCWTQPIKVISKLTQMGKREKSPSIKKRTTNDMIATTLTDMHRQLQEQSKCINLLTNKVFDLPNGSGQGANSESLQTLSNLISQHSMQGLNSSEFSSDITEQTEEKVVTLASSDAESAFRSFISAFSSIHPEERQQKLDLLLGAVPNEELGEFLDVFDASPVKKKMKMSRLSVQNNQ